MVDESARWRAQRQATLNKRYIVHYLLFLEEHRDTSAESFDIIERERANILAALEQACRGGRWVRVQRFTTILCPPDGFLAVRGYWPELTRNLKQAIELATARGDGRSITRLTQWLQEAESEAGSLDPDMDATIESQLREMREQIVLAQASVVMSHLGKHDSKIFAIMRDHDYSRGSLSSNELFLRLDPTDWPESYREIVRHKAGLLSQSARLAMRRKDLLRAKELWQEALRDLEQVGGVQDRAVVMSNLSITLRGLGNDASADALLQSARELTGGGGDDLRAGIMMAHQAIGAYQTGNFADAERLMQRSYDIFVRLGYKSGQSQILRVLAKLTEQRGDYDEARRLLQDSLKMDTELGDKAAIGQTWRLMGDVAAHAKDVAAADRCYDTALQISQERGDRYEIGALLSERGALASEAEALDIAADFLRQSLGFLQDTVSPELCKCLRRLGRVADKLGDLDEAQLCYQRALEVAKQLGSDDDLARSLFNLAGVLERREDLVTAESLFGQAVVVARRLGSESLSGLALFKLGNIHMHQGKLVQARQDYETALAESDQLDAQTVKHIHVQLQAIASAESAGS